MNTHNTYGIKRSVMRRVYYSFALRLLWSQATAAGILFAISLFWFAKLVHVAKVWEGFTAVPVGQVPGYIANTIMNSDTLTLLAIALMLGSLGMVLIKVRHVQRPTLITHRLA